MAEDQASATEPAADAAAQTAAEQSAPQTVETQPVDLTEARAEAVAGVGAVSPKVEQGAAPSAGEARPPWQKTAEEIDRADAEAAHAPTAALRVTSLGALAALVSRLGPLAGELQQILAGVDVGKLKSLLGALQELFAVPGETGSPAWIKAAAVAALKLLRTWSAIRPGNPDQELLDKLDRLIQAGGPALDALVGVVEQLFSHPPALQLPAGQLVTAQHVGDVAQSSHTEVFRAAAINPSTILAIIQAVFQLLQLFKNAKNPPALPAPAPSGA